MNIFKKKIQGVLLFLSISFFAYSQSGIYKTYEDFMNGNLEKYEVVNYTGAGFGMQVTGSNNGEIKERYKPKSIWGFLVKGNLFRSSDNLAYGLVDSGKVLFYINADARMNQIRNNSDYGSYRPGTGAECMFSANLKDELYTMPFNSYGTGMYKNYRKQYRKFMETYPEHQKLYDCIGDTYSIQEVSKCLHTYNSSK